MIGAAIRTHRLHQPGVDQAEFQSVDEAVGDDHDPQVAAGPEIDCADNQRRQEHFDDPG